MSGTESPCRFLSSADVLDNWSKIEPYFDRLGDRAADTPYRDC